METSPHSRSDGDVEFSLTEDDYKDLKEEFLPEEQQLVEPTTGSGASRPSTTTAGTNLFDDDDDDVFSVLTKENVAIYTHYAAVGIIVGLSKLGTHLCERDYFNREGDVAGSNDDQFGCDNMSQLITIAWDWKFFIALFTDRFRPFNMRRKPYLLAGWTITLSLILYIAVRIESFSAREYTLILLLLNGTLMIANVPMDGYLIQLALQGKDGSERHKGRIFMSATAVRFLCSMLVNIILAFFMNGPELNDGVEVAWDQAWKWGISVRSFIFTLWVLLCLCFIPMIFFKEVKCKAKPRTFVDIFKALHKVFNTRTAFNLIMHIAIFYTVGDISNKATAKVFQDTIPATLLQIGLRGTLRYAGITLGVLTFSYYLIHENWRQVNLWMALTYTVYPAFMWILVYHNWFGLRNGWFAVFIQSTQSYMVGNLHNLISMIVIEISTLGIEALCFQLVASISNAAGTVSSILGNQLYAALVRDKVDFGSQQLFDQTGGMWTTTWYTITVTVIQCTAIVISTRWFVPTGRHMCRVWNRTTVKKRIRYGWITFSTATLVIVYGTCISVIYFFPNVSCHESVGGQGCADPDWL